MTTPTQQIVQRGSYANDGTGDTLRDAAQKINDNFTYLWAEVWDSASTDNTIITRLNGLDSDVLSLTSRQDGLDSDVLAISGSLSDVLDASPSGGSTDDF